MPTISQAMRAATMFWLALTVQVAAPTRTDASVLSATPTLPTLGEPYASAVGAGCFPTAGVCIAAGSFVLTSIISNTFTSAGQDILAGVSFSGTLTSLGGALLGPIALIGTMEQEILGRTSATETGTWSAELLALTLTGPVLGKTLSVELDSASPSTGGASIVPIGNADEHLFKIDSFFDIFVELRLDSVPPLLTTRGPIRFELAPEPIPEPGSLAMIGLGILGLAAARRRRHAEPYRVARQLGQSPCWMTRSRSFAALRRV